MAHRNANRNVVPSETLEKALGNYDLRPMRKAYQQEDTNESSDDFLRKKFEKDKLLGSILVNWSVSHLYFEAKRQGIEVPNHPPKIGVLCTVCLNSAASVDEQTGTVPTAQPTPAPEPQPAQVPAPASRSASDRNTSPRDFVSDTSIIRVY